MNTHVRIPLICAAVILLCLPPCGCTTRPELIEPRVVNEPILDYPPEAIMERQSGILVARFLVREDGSTDEFLIHQSTGSDSLDKAGMAFVRRLECFPAVINGVRKPAWVEQQVIFKLERKALDPLEWKDTVHDLIVSLERASPERRAAIAEDLYEECGNYMSSAITRPDLFLNRMALKLVAEPVRQRWEPYTDTFPLSFLMFADFVDRSPDAAMRTRALDQVRQAVDVDLRRLDQRLARESDPRLTTLRAGLVAYARELDQSNE